MARSPPPPSVPEGFGALGTGMERSESLLSEEGMPEELEDAGDEGAEEAAKETEEEEEVFDPFSLKDTEHPAVKKVGVEMVRSAVSLVLMQAGSASLT